MFYDEPLLKRIVKSILDEQENDPNADFYFPIYESYDDSGLEVSEYEQFAAIVLNRFLKEYNGE